MKNVIFNNDNIVQTSQTTSTHQSITYQDTFSYLEPAFNHVIIKNNNINNYVHNVFTVKKTTDMIYTYNDFYPIKSGYIYDTEGLKKWWYKPTGIDGFLNVAIQKSAPWKMIVAKYKNSYAKADLIEVVPEGLENLSQILKIQFASANDTYAHRIIIVGVHTNGRYGIWQCDNEETYNFNLIWLDEVDTAPTNIGAQSIQITSFNIAEHTYNVLTVKLYFSSTKSKIVRILYDHDYDKFYYCVTVINGLTYLYSIGDCFYASTTTQNLIRYNLTTSTPYPDTSFSNFYTLTWTTDYTQFRFEGSLNDLFISCSNGYVYRTKNKGASFITVAGSDNAYRIIQYAIASGGYFGVNNASTNYWMHIGVNGDNIWTSKITFPTSSYSNKRVQLPRNYIAQLDSSNIYAIDYDKLISGTNQTLTAQTMTDANGNAFISSQIYWNGATEGTILVRSGHTFYMNTNGDLISETNTYNGLVKENASLGAPGLLMSTNY